MVWLLPFLLFSCRALREHGDRPSYPTSFFSILFARIIHEGFYCNRRYTATTSLYTDSQCASERARRLVGQRTVQVRFPPSLLRAPVSRGVSAVSSRTLVNNAG